MKLYSARFSTDFVLFSHFPPDISVDICVYVCAREHMCKCEYVYIVMYIK